MSSPSAAIRIMPIVDPHIEESSKHRPLHWLRDPHDLRMVSANREAKQGVAVITRSKVVALSPFATHLRHDVCSRRIRIAEFDPAVWRGGVVVFGDGPMTPNSGKHVSGDRRDREENRWQMCGSGDRC